MDFRIIPVLDLKDGVAVHAVRGERASYAPARSVLAPSSDPLDLARAFARRLGCRECYIADLDAIAHRGNHVGTVRAIAATGLRVWLDAGASTTGEAQRVLAEGAARVIIGTETLRDPGELERIAAAVDTAPAPGAGRCILSLDLRGGVLLGGSPAVQGFDPVTLAATAWEGGIRSFIVLDLGRVGSGGGVDTRTAHRVRQALPDAEIVVGGGVRDGDDLRSLARAGFDGALVATALHTGAITSETLTALG